MTSLRRAPAPELMDQPEISSAALAHALADLRAVNRWFGGSRTALRVLLPELRKVTDEPVSVLDVGTGSGDIPRDLVSASRREGRSLRVVATDLHPETVAIAAARLRDAPAIEVRQADGLALPFADAAFDIAMCHTALHHFEDDQALRLIRELSRCARHAVVVTDLVRGRLPLAVVGLLSRSLWRRHPITRHDSVVSIRAAFTPGEAARLAYEAGLQEVRVRRHPFFRFSLVARPGRQR